MASDGEIAFSAPVVYQTVLAEIVNCLQDGYFEGASLLSDTAVNLYNITAAEAALAQGAENES